MDVDFANACPLVRPALPHTRFLFVGSRLCSTLPSDGPSRFRPCASLVLHLHQVAQGTFTPKLPDMSDTQAQAPALTAAASAPKRSPRSGTPSSRAFSDAPVYRNALDVGGECAYRVRGEDHVWTAQTVAALQHAVRGDSYERYRGTCSV